MLNPSFTSSSISLNKLDSTNFTRSTGVSIDEETNIDSSIGKYEQSQGLSKEDEVKYTVPRRRVCFPSFFSSRTRHHPRRLRVGYGPVTDDEITYPKNIVRNQKYNIISFVPLVLFQQFKYFLNLFFLACALTQFFEAFHLGQLITYWGPLGFVLTITLIREAFDDFVRFLRDKELNSEKYEKLTRDGLRVEVKSRDIFVGDVIVIQRNRRVPADVLLLRTTEKSGACFIRTDQLDGETDWKLKIAVPFCQNLHNEKDLMTSNMEIFAEKPRKDINSFVGTYRVPPNSQKIETAQEGSLNIENVLWASTVLTSGTALGIVIYTGPETRSVMNTSAPSSKVGLLDLEINDLTKVLFAFVAVLSAVMVIMKGLDPNWWKYFVRYILLFSYIIPISMRVNLDLAKIYYAWLIGRDKSIPDTVVRSSTIPEELGRISYLLSDKTGTLTKNEMHFKKLHMGTSSFSSECFGEVARYLTTAYSSKTQTKSIATRLKDAVEAIALCHNVTPLLEHEKRSYQAASPDEVALVKWTEAVGVCLDFRDLHSMRLQLADGNKRGFNILHIFPFTSETKRMGIIVRDEANDGITLYIKGADTVMAGMVQYNDWLEEESSNMAREGLRTLVIAKRTLTQYELDTFEKAYHQAQMRVVDRTEHMRNTINRLLERDLELLCVTGVEDKLQDQVTTSLELLRNAGIKTWMLTGDKLETAICIAKSSGLFSRNEKVHVMGEVTSRSEAQSELRILQKDTEVALVVSGTSLKVLLQYYEMEFAQLVLVCTSVVCCRCSPQQKAQVVNLLRKYNPTARIAAIGDGGNDVSMIQAAHAGIGIEAHEGKQASLAADFAVTQFSHICRLLLVHGRLCYKRSSCLSQFVMHRGLIISTIQAIFSCVFYFASVSLYQGPLMVLYTTGYTTFPVFSLVLDRDVTDQNALIYPELYKELKKGRSLSYKTFCIWVLVSIYQGAVIMYGAVFAFERDFYHVVSITFTALILTELIMITLTVRTWHWAMIVAEAFSLGAYGASLYSLDKYFDLYFMLTIPFFAKTTIITVVSCLPFYVIKVVQYRFNPPTYTKVT